MNAYTALTLMLWMVVATLAAGRDFTDSKGRKLSGELVSATAEVASLKLPDGRVMTVPVKLLCAEDQQFVAEYAAANVRASFDVKWTKTKLGKSKERNGVYTVQSEDWAYKVLLTSRSSTDLAALRVDYWIFRRDDDGKVKAGPRVRASGSTEFALFKKSATQEFQTTAFTLTKEQLDADYYHADGSRNTKRDTAGGFALKVFQGEHQVFEWATDKDLLEAVKSAAPPSKEASETSKNGQ